jgi:vancomycin resistance protein VanJ
MLSRYPLTADEYWRTVSVPQSMGHQRVEIDVDSVRFTLYNVHPIHPAMTGRLFDPIPRALEITELMARAGEDDGTVVLMGDFNLTDLSEDYAHITARYGDTYWEVGWGMGFTFPDFSQPQALPRFLSNTTALPPFIRLDYIFHNKGVQPLEAQVWPDAAGSDHRPLYARLALVSTP